MIEELKLKNEKLENANNLIMSQFEDLKMKYNNQQITNEELKTTNSNLKADVEKIKAYLPAGVFSTKAGLVETKK